MISRPVAEQRRSRSRTGVDHVRECPREALLDHGVNRSLVPVLLVFNDASDAHFLRPSHRVRDEVVGDEERRPKERHVGHRFVREAMYASIGVVDGFTIKVVPNEAFYCRLHVLRVHVVNWRRIIWREGQRAPAS